MKKVLILSDSHGRKDLISKTIELHKDVDIIFHLGDFSQDIMDFVYEREVYSVKGNMDPLFPKTDDYAKDEILISIEGLKMWLLHGHRYEAHYGIEKMLNKAKEKEIDIVCYGHTHKSEFVNKDGIYFFNPGALKSLSYGLMRFENGKSYAEILTLKG